MVMGLEEMDRDIQVSSCDENKYFSKAKLMRAIFKLAKILMRTPLFPTFFQEIVASISVGGGSKAYREKRYEDALKILEPVANFEIDSPYVGSAQYLIGLLYFHGRGVAKDLDRAEGYFKKAACRENEDAIEYLSRKRNYQAK